MKSTMIKILLIILTIVITGIVAFAKISSDRIGSVSSVYNYPNNKSVEPSLQAYPDILIVGNIEEFTHIY